MKTRFALGRQSTLLAASILLASSMLQAQPAPMAQTVPAKPGLAELIGTFSVEPFGGDTVQIADLRGDGENELLILQSAGQFCSKLYRGRSDLDDVDRSLYCLTVVTMKGKVLWQDGTPYHRDFPFTSHGAQGGNLMLAVTDLYANGKVEVIVLRHGELAVLEAATGKTLAHTPLPSDNFVDISTAQFGPREKGRQIICKVNDLSFKPWEYANPIVVYNADLSIYHECFAGAGAGHNFVTIEDANGNGPDKLLMGYSLLDHNLKTIWKLDLGPGFDYAAEHADHIAVSDLQGEGTKVVRYAGSKDFFVTDLDGNMIWKATAGHSQASAAGPWGPQGEQRIVMAEKNRGLWGLDANGQILWHRKDINGYATASVHWTKEGLCQSWALFRPQMKPMRPTPYSSDPNWSVQLWPKFLASDGTPLDVFPWKDEYTQPKQLIRAERSYDCGVKYYAIAKDLDRDGLDEVIVHDRRRVWIFHAPR